MRIGERIGMWTRAAAIAALATWTAIAADGADWAHWRGPSQTGVSPETGLAARWSPDGESLLWKGEVIVRSTPVVMNGRAYAIARVGKDITEQEQVACFDVKTGALLWEDRFNLFHTTVPFNRVGWANLAGDPETGYVYAHGVGGVFNCYTSDGEIVWSKSLTEEFGRISGYGGRTNSPIVEGDLVVLGFLNSAWGAMGPGRHRVFAFDKRTGEPVWIATLPGAPLDTLYSVPVAADIGGQRLLVMGGADGNVYALQARTGKIVWSFQLSKRGLNVSPVVDGWRVYIAHSEENYDSNAMGRVVCIDGRGSGDVTKTHELWRIDGLGVGYASPAIHDGRLYVIDNSANLIAIDAETGTVRWTHSLGTVGRGSPTIADGKIYAADVNGRIHILQPRDAECIPLDTDLVAMPDGRPAEIYGSAAVAYGRVFLPTEAGLFCIGSADAPVRAASLSATTAAAALGEPAHLQILPAEALLHPGESALFRLRLFDANGNPIGAAETASWEMTGLTGSLTDGAFLADAVNPQAGTITASVGSLKATARVRVAPRFPYEEDFEKVPVGVRPGFWLSAGRLHKVVELEGNRVLQQIPAETGLSNATVLIGSPRDSGYTIQADVMGTKPRRNMPDIGLIANRYTLALQGNHQRIQTYDWASDLRVSAEVPYKWEPNVWHTMKMRVDYADGKAFVRGKVWRRDDPEPEAWTVIMEDPLPNREGSPGLYGFSFADLYFDNLRIIESN